MKYLIMTEGTCEKAFVDLLVERGLLKYSKFDLLYNQTFHARQLNETICEMILQLNKNEKITIIRIGDKLDDKLSINGDFKEKIVKEEKICIKPEFEILLIINEGKFNSFIKKRMKPSHFIKTILRDYKKKYTYNYDYFSKLSNNDLVNLIKNYHHLRHKTHPKGVKSLVSILK